MAEYGQSQENDSKKKLCRDCGKEIKFIKNKDTGKFMPVDAEPIKIIIVDDDRLGRVKLGYLPHWETCEAIKENGNLY